MSCWRRRRSGRVAAGVVVAAEEAGERCDGFEQQRVDAWLAGRRRGWARKLGDRAALPSGWVACCACAGGLHGGRRSLACHQRSASARVMARAAGMLAGAGAGVSWGHGLVPGELGDRLLWRRRRQRWPCQSAGGRDQRGDGGVVESARQTTARSLCNLATASSAKSWSLRPTSIRWWTEVLGRFGEIHRSDLVERVEIR